MMELLGSVESLLSQIISPRNLKWFGGVNSNVDFHRYLLLSSNLIFATKHHTCGPVHTEFQNHHKKESSNVVNTIVFNRHLKR